MNVRDIPLIAMTKIEVALTRHRYLTQVAVGALVFFSARHAFADVAGALQSSGTGASGWAQAGGTIGAIVCGARVAMGQWAATIPMGAGVVTMAQPAEVTGYLGL